MNISAVYSQKENFLADELKCGMGYIIYLHYY